MTSRLKIAISQRREEIEARGECRDALDVRLSSLIWDLGFLPVLLTSGTTSNKDYIRELSPSGFILSGGNDLDPASPRDQLEGYVLQYAIDFELPVLGICRGMQFINVFQGGSLRRVPGHTATTHSLSSAGALKNYDRVNSYHDFGLKSDDLGRDLEVLAESTDGVIEAIRHIKHSWLGIMWHPERDVPISSTDRLLIKNHFLGLDECK